MSAKILWAGGAVGVLALGLAYELGRAHAEGIPDTEPLAYSATVKNENGAPLTGSHQVSVGLWTAQSGGSQACSAPASLMDIPAGRLRVALPSACVDQVQVNRDLWIELTVDQTTFPRTKVGAVPYSVEAKRASSARQAEGPLEDRIRAVEARGGGVTANIGVTYVNGRFSITQADGTPFHAAAPGLVTMPHSMPGRLVTLKVTADVHFFDDASAATPTLTGMPFGTTAGVEWGEARPFAVYAVNTDDTDSGLHFGLSPNPTMATLPLDGATLGSSAVSPTAHSDGGAFVLYPGNPAAFAAAPVVLIGTIRMTKDASDTWRVAPLDHGDGIGPHHLQHNYGARRYVGADPSLHRLSCRIRRGARSGPGHMFSATRTGLTTSSANPCLHPRYVFPAGQMGATSGAYFAQNGGTPPRFGFNEYVYSLGLDGRCRVDAILVSVDTPGSGTPDALLALPYEAQADYALYFGAMNIYDGIHLLRSRAPADARFAYVDGITVAQLDGFNGAFVFDAFGRR